MATVADLIEFTRRAEPTSSLVEPLLAYLSNVQQRNHGGRRFLHFVDKASLEEDEWDFGFSSMKTPVKMAGRAAGLSIFGPVAGFILKKTLRYSALLTRWLAITAGRAVVRFALVPVLKILTTFVATPPGLLITGIASAVGLGYFLYKTMFRGESPSKEFRPPDVAESAPRAGRRAEDLIYEPPSVQDRHEAPQIPSDHVYASVSKISEGQRIIERHRSSRIRDSIKEASRRTGVGEDVLNAIAYKESRFREVASPGTSSAQGLFQFIDSTWTSVLKRYGPRYGVSPNASRNDPLASAIMAGAYLKHDIYPSISRARPNPSATDLYMGHFMGPGGGAQFLRGLDRHPNRYAYLDFAKAAESNPWVYFHDFKRLGRSRPKTYAQIYNSFAGDLQMIQAAVQAELKAVPSQKTTPSTPQVVPLKDLPPEKVESEVPGFKYRISPSRNNTEARTSPTAIPSTEERSKDIVNVNGMLVAL